ncbi:MAG: type I methionyl aminopeptidase [Nitrolancea sp.]
MAITLKSARELEIMRRAGKIVAEVLELMRQEVRPGVTTGELDRMSRELIELRGASPSFLGHQGFTASICASVNEEVVHGIPGPRTLVEGDIFSIDVGALLEGYHADSALTLPVGEISDKARRLIEVTEQAFFRGVEFARAGNRIGDISAAVQQVATDAGYGIVRELTGHGIGRSLWEDPTIPNFGRSGTGAVLRPGMTIAIEPMFTIGDARVRILDDGWTIVTDDGELSAHYEHTVLITPEDPELLTR